jgi:tetratricopeptide (TPR) repeat protein
MSVQHGTSRTRWPATLIIGLFLVGIAVSAAVGWRYARESPPHQGPIVLIVVDSFRGDAIGAGPRLGSNTPAIDALAADSVVFTRAYTHSTTYLTALGSIATGLLPVAHGVRDDAGFVLGENVRTAAELMRNRGFVTGGAVSTFLLRRASGFGQGFSFYDTARPDTPPPADMLVSRDGLDTYEAAEAWMRAQGEERYFLWLDVDHAAAEPVVARLVNELKARNLYDTSTLILTAARGEGATGTTLDESMLRVPLVVKQPSALGAGRQIEVPVQHADIVPTLLDFVRAPIPGGLAGRSLRPVLDDADVVLPPAPVYSESLEAVYRFGGFPLYALTVGDVRLVRGARDEAVVISSGVSSDPAALVPGLDAVLARATASRPDNTAPSDERALAASGYLPGLRRGAESVAMLEPGDQRAVLEAHRAAVRRLAVGDRVAAIAALRAIARTHPELAVVQLQLGEQLARAGRLTDAIAAFKAADMLAADDPQVAAALAAASFRAGRLADARGYAEDAVARAQSGDVTERVSARVVALEVALSTNDAESAAMHVAEIERADSRVPLGDYVEGRVATAEGRYADAAAALQNAARALGERAWVVPDLQMLLGDALAQLDRGAEAEAAYRQALESDPRNVRAYAGLATLYHATNRETAMSETLDALITTVPTAESYVAAARVWTSAGNEPRATALRAEARRRFRGDPALARSR